MNSIEKTYRCIYLSKIGVGKIIPQRRKGVHFDSHLKKDLVETFVAVAIYSNQTRTSLRMMRILLNTMDANEVLLFKSVLSEPNLDSILSAHERDREATLSYIAKAQKWLSVMEMPFSLQHFARHAIIRAMSHRSLHGVSELGLPKRVEQYVLLKTDYIERRNAVPD